MPAIPTRARSAFSGDTATDKISLSTPPKRRLRSNSTVDDEIPSISSAKWKSPRRCINSIPTSLSSGIDSIDKEFSDELVTLSRSPFKKSSDNLFPKPKWNPLDAEQMRVVKEALHVSTPPCSVVCREEELKKVLEFCKGSVEKEKSGSLYVCGCPGTGKTISMEKVKQTLFSWSTEINVHQPNVLYMNCTSLTKSCEIFTKILQHIQPKRKLNGSTTALKHIQNLYAQEGQLPDKEMLVLIIDELDYLITIDREVLHELFMLTMMPFSNFQDVS